MPDGGTVKIAAIDVGSNGMRLLLGELRGDGSYRVGPRKRVFGRFGEEPFQYGEFRQKSFDLAFKLFGKFSRIMEREGVRHCLCVATSAFREAKNSSQLVQAVAERFHLSINVVDGQLESDLVIAGVWGEIDCGNHPYILIDIGGGSTEIVLAQGKRNRKMLSVEVGTVRLLPEMERPSMGGPQLHLLREGMAREILPALAGGGQVVPVVGTGGKPPAPGEIEKNHAQWGGRSNA